MLRTRRWFLQTRPSSKDDRRHRRADGSNPASNDGAADRRNQMRNRNYGFFGSSFLQQGLAQPAGHFLQQGLSQPSAHFLAQGLSQGPQGFLPEQPTFVVVNATTANRPAAIVVSLRRKLRFIDILLNLTVRQPTPTRSRSISTESVVLSPSIRKADATTETLALQRSVVGVTSKRAAVALRLGSTVILSHGHQQSVVFVVHRHIRRQGGHEEGSCVFVAVI